MNEQHNSKVRAQFGVAAGDYAISEIHARGESLAVLFRLPQPKSDWRMLDVATGAGHTALAFAPHVDSVAATDLTEAMLSKTDEMCGAAGLLNVKTQ